MTRVLIVEDDVAGGRVLAQLLRSEGYTVRVVTEATAALPLARFFDVLLVDMGLPGMSGADMIADLRVNHVRTPAILISARPHDDIAEEAAICGASSWLPKPLDRATLVQAIEEVLTRRSLLP